MKKVNLNVVAVVLAVLAIFGLVKGQVVIFLGFLALSGMILGAERMMKLEEDENAVKSIKKKNIQLAILGVIFGLISNTGIDIMDLLASFAFGTCFGLIGVNMIFERSKK